MYSIRVSDQRMSFSASHFVITDEYFENLHGHNYTLEIVIEGPLDEYGMVIDFRDIKKQAMTICKTLDHKILLPGKSELIVVKEEDEFVEAIIQDKRYVFPKSDCVILPFRATTVELLAKHICGHLKLADELQLEVCVSESPGSTGCFGKD